VEKKRKFKWSGRLGKTVLSCFIAGQALLVTTLLGGFENKAAAADPVVVSTWMWNPYEIGNDKDNTLKQLTDHSVNRVYLFIDPSYPAGYYRSFIKDARSKGIEVRAMSGAPNWVLPEYNKKMYEFIYWVTQYNNSSQPEERFSGIQLDVEPYVLPQWRQDSDTVIGQWMDTVSGFAQEVKSEDASLTVGIDMPIWLDTINVRDGYGGRIALYDWLMRHVDQVTLMAYRDNAKDIMDSVQNEIATADRLGVQVLVAVDSVNTGDAGTFYGKGQASMLNELNTVISSMGSHTSFKGYSVHEWDSWLKLGQ
jgi:hypothetical protein